MSTFADKKRSELEQVKADAAALTKERIAADLRRMHLEADALRPKRDISEIQEAEIVPPKKDKK